MQIDRRVYPEKTGFGGVTGRVPDRAAGLLGTVCRRAQPLGGGSLSEIWRLELEDGADAVVKRGAAPGVEARMLEALRAAGVPAPAVLAVSDDLLIIEALAHDGRFGEAWPDLGRVLAHLHAVRGARYGWTDDCAFGTVALVNEPADVWPSFWGEHRLVSPSSGLPARYRRRIELLAADLDNRLPRQPAPALLHGDLWGGNILVSGGRVTGLIDPACYFGDAEVDLAMLTVFDAPADALFDAYGGRAPGHRERLPIYQLWPAIVHVRLFGSGYLAMLDRLLKNAGV